MTKILVIIFDLGQTLIDSAAGFRKTEKLAESKIFQDLGLDSWFEFLSNYRRFRYEYHAMADYSRRSLWQAIYQYHGQEPNEELIAKEENIYWEMIRSATKLFPETISALEEIAHRYRLALITNTQGQENSSGHRIKMFPSLEKLFEVVLIAGENGILAKPDPMPFLKCLEILEIDPQQAIYVGDDWRIDICGAQSVGIQPVWLKHYSLSRKWPVAETKVPIIFSLDQILELDIVV